MSLAVTVRLRTIEAFLLREHGSVRQLTVRERRILRGFVRRMELAIEDNWPVDTGFSRDGWRSAISGNVTGGGIQGLSGIGFQLFNDVDYARYVRRRGELAAGLPPLGRRLARQVVVAFAASLNAALMAEIRNTEAQQRQGVPFLELLQRVGPQLPGALSG